ncbi:MAG TPA: precorrin-4 C(11)-methyltransferase [Candidatus Angelobacter sp.]|jgi:cobalt-precorrin 5A hydrolase/precorrin-3B C17-methyltransferase|nr:precorrin-4 C(11)-methyltransferase [Candidatus Angelobacter sp.]
MSAWTPRPGTVYIVGAGPGDPDLMTVRARRVLEAAGLVLYADSLVDPRMFDMVSESAQVRGTSGMTLDPIVERMVTAARSGLVVARVHSGDPGVYGAVAEQLARLEDAGVAWEIVPGVPSPMAAAAALGCEMTVPGVTQSIVFCRVAGRTPMPDGQDLRAHARPGVSLCVFLSAGYGAELVAALRDGGVADDTPAVIAEKVSWPDERVSWGLVGDVEQRLRDMGVRRHALVLVGPAFARASTRLRSSLYSPDHAHVFRPRGEAARGVQRDRDRVVIYAITAGGAEIARRIRGALPEARVHLPARLAGADADAVAEEGSARAVVARLMGEAGGVVLVMATGAAVRLAAPHLEDKLRDPSVVAVDDRGRFAVPLAGAHAGGGNELARRVAVAIGATAVVTTASDGRAWPALDDLAAHRGWRVEDPRQLAHAGAALLDGDPVALLQDCGEPLESAGLWPASLRRVADLGGLQDAAWRAAIVVTDRVVAAREGWVVLRPPSLVLGVGCEAGVSREELVEAVDASLLDAQLSPLSVGVVATLDRKTEEPALRLLCEERGWALRGYEARALRDVVVPTPSAVVEEAVGTPSVSEAAALLEAGTGELLAAKRVHHRVTVAIARRGSGAAAVPRRSRDSVAHG